MATTTNFGWETPDDTDLVKDGAAAMRTLGNAIDTSFVDLKGGTTNQVLAKNSNTDLDFKWVTSAGDIEGVTAGVGITGGGTTGTVTITNDMATKIDAKGDLVVGTGADTYDRLAVGTNGHVLTADSTESTGTKWAAVATTKNFSLLGTGTLTGATTITVSGISGMDKIYVLFKNVSSVNASSNIRLRINTDTGNNYTYLGPVLIANATYNASDWTFNNSSNFSYFELAQMSNNAGSRVAGGATIEGCNTAGKKMIQTMASGLASSGSGAYQMWNYGFWSGTGTITSISIVSSTGNFDDGDFDVYGSA